MRSASVDPFRDRPPEGDCAGWLMHNRQVCACYSAERAAELEARSDALVIALNKGLCVACLIVVAIAFLFDLTRAS